MLTPPPHPYPQGHAPLRINWAYTYTTTAENPHTHKLIPDMWFTCHVPVHGKRICIRYRQSEAATSS